LSHPKETNVSLGKIDRIAIHSILVFNRDSINYLQVKNMYIQLKPEQEQFIQAQMASGRYENADDVINEAFKLLEEREKRLSELQQKIAVGTKQIVQGRVTDGEIVFDRLQEKIRKIAEESEG
jgi:antitoxin ParD1/3/4